MTRNSENIANSNLLNGRICPKIVTNIDQIEKPLITVVTVVFNNAAHLESTIKNVISQTYENIEYIIIDGGSTDGTLDIIRKYEDQIDYWVSEKDSGIYCAMNKGIDVATGEWINFMNSGDLFYSNTTIESIFSCQINGSVVYGNTLYHYSSEHRKLRKPGKDLTFKNGLPFCHQSTFVKKSILKTNRFSDLYKIYADFDLFAKLKKTNELFTYVDLTVSIFNCNGVSAAKSLTHLKELYCIGNKYQLSNSIFLVISLFIREIFKKIIPIKIVKLIQVLK